MFVERSKQVKIVATESHPFCREITLGPTSVNRPESEVGWVINEKGGRLRRPSFFVIKIVVAVVFLLQLYANVS